MKNLVFGILFFIVSISLTNGLSIVNAQENIQEDKYPKIITTNLTQLFGEPIHGNDRY